MIEALLGPWVREYKERELSWFGVEPNWVTFGDNFNSVVERSVVPWIGFDNEFAVDGVDALVAELETPAASRRGKSCSRCFWKRQ